MAVSTFDSATASRGTFKITGGTGKYKAASGKGTYKVPAITVFSPGLITRIPQVSAGS